MTASSADWSLEKSIASDTESGIALISEVVSRLRDAAWDETDLFGVHLAVEEAVMNAIKHGNQEDPAKCVEVICQLAGDRFEISITDQGSGFSREDVPDPTMDENLEKTSGRGLMLMEFYMSEVIYNERGNSVTMVKRRGEQPQFDDE